MIGLAVGSLASSAVFHLIPGAFRLGEAHESVDGKCDEMFPHHNYLNISLTIFGGIYLFFIIERLLKIVMDARARRAEEVMVEHSHSHSVETVVVSSDSQLALPQPGLSHQNKADKPAKRRIATV